MKNEFKKTIEWLALIYLFLLPWQTVYIFSEKSIGGFKSPYLTGQIFATEILLWLIIILYLINLIVNFQPPLSSFRLKPLNFQKIFVLCLWFFLAYAGLSIFWAAEQAAAFYLWLRFLAAAALLLIILTGKIDKIKIFWALLFSTGLQGLLAIQQFLSQSISADKWLGIAYHSAGLPGDIVIETASGRWLRAYGAFAHPNILGGFLLLGLITAACLWQNYAQAKNKRWQQLIILIISPVIAAGLFFSFSRSAWLAALIILIIAMVISITKLILKKQALSLVIRNWSFCLAPLALFLSLVWIFSPLVLARADLGNRLEVISNSGRLDQVSEAAAIIKNKPVKGTGLNNYTVALAKIYPGRPAYELQPVHNLYLLAWAETGLIGLAIFLLLIFATIKPFWQHKIIPLAAAPFGACLIIGLFDHYFWTQYAGIMIFWLALTIGLGYIKVINQEPYN